MPNWLNQQETLDDIAAMLCNDITHIYARQHESGNWKLSSSRIPICQSQAAAHGIWNIWSLHLIMTMTKKSPAKKSIGKEMAIKKKTTNVENWQRTKIWETFWQTYWILKLSHSHYPTMTLRFIAQFKWGFMTDFSTFFFVIWQSILMVDCGRNWVCSILRFRWNR